MNHKRRWVRLWLHQDGHGDHESPLRFTTHVGPLFWTHVISFRTTCPPTRPLLFVTPYSFAWQGSSSEEPRRAKELSQREAARGLWLTPRFLFLAITTPRPELPQTIPRRTRNAVDGSQCITSTRSPASVRWLSAQHSGIFWPVHTGSGYAIWVLVTPPMLWSHFTYHIYSISRTSSPRHIPSSLMFSPHHSSVRSLLRTT